MAYINVTNGNNVTDFKIIPDKIKDLIVNILFIGAGSFISLFGVFSNIINIAVYLKQGIKDSPTVQFLSLSITDCAFSVLAFVSSMCVFFEKIKPNLTVVDPLSLGYCVAQARENAYSLSVCITFLMSIERCFCVAFPFKVKYIFTKERCQSIVACFAIFFVALSVPEFLNQGLTMAYDMKFNSTRLLFWTKMDGTGVYVLKNTFIAGVLPILSGITTTLCAVYMISAVRSSASLRQSNTTYKDQNKEAKNSDKSTNKKYSLLGKDVRLARTVIAVDIIFITCNIPKWTVLASSIVTLYIPEFSILVPGKYQNIVTVLMTLTFTFEVINGACTFLVYFISSTKFRTTFIHHFCKIPKAD